MRRNIFVKDNIIIIRELCLNDATVEYLNFFRNPSKYILFSKINNVFSLRKYIFENILSSNSILLGIFYKEKHIGNIRIHEINDLSAVLGIYLGNKRFQGKGLAKNIFSLIFPKLKKILKISYIYLGVDRNNSRAISAFKKSGFKPLSLERKKIFNQNLMVKKLIS